VGVCVQSLALGDPALARLVTRQFSQITAEWEMKMEAILEDGGGLDFSRCDRILAFAAEHGLRVHGHTLIWYAQNPKRFQNLDGRRGAFERSYLDYIDAVAEHCRGRVVSWDVVNEPMTDDAAGALRDCVWRANLGDGYIALAFHAARRADPGALLFINDYNLESNPAKRHAFLRLAESLLKAGAPLGGLGAQSHLDVDLPPGRMRETLSDLSRLGLPVHISELDVSTRTGRLDFSSEADRALRQARLVHETVEAFMNLPARQRFAITLWGARDGDSWLRRPPFPAGQDKPLLFDDHGRPKLAASAFLHAVAGRSL
jgi:endo-1,4-beta-xylanase